MKILYIGDNRNRENWGCRATSKALKDLISQKNNISYTMYGDVVGENIPFFEHENLSFVKQLLYKLCSVKGLRKFKKYFKLYESDFIVEDIDKSIERFYAIAKQNALYKEILQKVQEGDAIIINGEGDAIFTTPFRRKFLFLLMIMKIAQNNYKKTFYVNAMFSDCPKSGRNLNTLNQTIDILSQCTLVIARDLDSFDYLNQFEHNINLKYVPDALFSWTKYENYLENLIKYPTALIPFPEYDKYWDNFNFTQPYICVSGGSSAAWSQEEACIGYVKLVQVLKQQNYKLIIVPTAPGDSFLYDVAEQTQVPIIPVNTNIFGGMSILANATVFVSGRWHPSILASLGGTPCVMFGSNSSKTKSFLKMLDYEKQTEFSAIPKEEEFNDIIADIENYIQQGSRLREKIKIKVKELSELMDFYKTIQ